jgi:hypothetical protein
MMSEALYRAALRVLALASCGQARTRADDFKFEGGLWRITDFKSDGSIVAECYDPKVRSWVVPEE